MSNQLLRPRKRRTRQHVIADLSINHLERLILEAGHTAQRLGSDYGYDLVMWTFDEDGFVEPGSVYFQCKAAERLNEKGTEYVFDLDLRDYNRWVQEKMPIILVLFDAGRKRAYWLAVQKYFGEEETRRPQKAAKTVRVRVPKRQVVNREAIARMRDLSHMAFNQEKAVLP